MIFDTVEYDVGANILTHFGVFERNVIAGPTQQLAGEHADFNIKRLDGTYRFNNASTLFHPRGRYRWDMTLVPPAYVYEDGWRGLAVYNADGTLLSDTVKQLELSAGIDRSLSHEGERVTIGVTAGGGGTSDGVTNTQVLSIVNGVLKLTTGLTVGPDVESNEITLPSGGGPDASNAIINVELQLLNNKLNMRMAELDGGLRNSTPVGGLTLPRQDWSVTDAASPLRVVNRPLDSNDSEAISGSVNARRITSPHETRINANAAITSLVKRYARDATHLIQTADIDPSVFPGSGTTVVANPGGSPAAELTTVTIGTTDYALPAGGGGVPGNYQRTQVGLNASAAQATAHTLTLTAEPTVGMDIEIELRAVGGTTARTTVLLSAEVFRALTVVAAPAYTDTATAWGTSARQVDVTSGGGALDQIYVWRTNANNLGMAVGWRQGGNAAVHVFNVIKGGAQGPAGGGGTTVVANPTAVGTVNLAKLQVGSTVYTIPAGGGTADGVISGLEVDFPNDQLRVSAARTVGTSPVRSPSIAIPAAAIPDLPASKITTGHMHTERLGTGVAGATTFLRGDQTWAVPAGGVGATFDIHDDLTTLVTPANADRIALSDENVAGDPMGYTTLGHIVSHVATNIFLNASRITAGTVATARLGTGTADATAFLRGDQTWAIPAGGGAAFDIHDDVTAPRGIVDGDHIVFSAESLAGDPMRYCDGGEPR